MHYYVSVKMNELIFIFAVVHIRSSKHWPQKRWDIIRMQNFPWQRFYSTQNSKSTLLVIASAKSLAQAKMVIVHLKIF